MSETILHIIDFLDFIKSCKKIFIFSNNKKLHASLFTKETDKLIVSLEKEYGSIYIRGITANIITNKKFTYQDKNLINLMKYIRRYKSLLKNFKNNRNIDFITEQEAIIDEIMRSYKYIILTQHKKKTK